MQLSYTNCQLKKMWSNIRQQRGILVIVNVLIHQAKRKEPAMTIKDSENFVAIAPDELSFLSF